MLYNVVMASKNSSNEGLRKLIAAVVIVLVLIGIGIFGFNFFSRRANNMKALSELKQIQEIMLTNLVSTDGSADKEIICDGVTFKYAITKGRAIFEGSLETNDNGETFTKEIKENFSELDEFDGTFNLDGDVLTYTTSNGKGKAIWKSGGSPKSS